MGGVEWGGRGEEGFFLSFSCLFFSSSSFLPARSAAAVRKRREEESTASPDAPSTGEPRVGRASPEKCRWLRSLLSVPGSARMPGRAPAVEHPSVAVARRSSRAPAPPLALLAAIWLCGAVSLPGPPRSTAARVATTSAVAAASVAEQLL